MIQQALLGRQKLIAQLQENFRLVRFGMKADCKFATFWSAIDDGLTARCMLVFSARRGIESMNRTLFEKRKDFTAYFGSGGAKPMADAALRLRAYEERV
jgi:hypothetical protein